MTPAAPPTGRSSAPVPKKEPFFLWGDLPAALLTVAGAAALVLVPRLYRPTGPTSFPKQPSEFMSPAELERVTAAAQAALEKTPDDLSALTSLTLAAYQGGPDRALDCIEYGERALALGALDERLFYYTGACHELKGTVNYAEEAFEKYLRHHPSDLETRMRLGNLYERSGELEKAQAAFTAVLAARPGDPLVSFNLAVVLRDRQQWKEGLDVLLPVWDRDKTVPTGGFRVLGDLCRGAKRTDEALDFYRREQEHSPDDADLLAAVAQTLDDAGRQEPALDAWKRVLDLNPKSKQAYARVRALNRALRAAARKKT